MKSMKIGMMKKIQKHNTVEMLQYSGLSGCCNISHFVTTRHGGVSRGSYATLNPGEYSGDADDSVQRNRKLISEAMAIPAGRLFAPYQVHGCRICRLEASFLSLSPELQAEHMHGADALITDRHDVCVAVSTADCVPLLLYAPDRGVVAAVHAGWRGTVQHIAAKTVRIMVEHYACNPAQMMAAIGPSIGVEAFEVGDEVADAFRTAGADMGRISVRNAQSGKTHIDLWEANRLQLVEVGLQNQRIETAGICTYTHCDDLFSARRLGIKSGRILSGILIKSVTTTP